MPAFLNIDDINKHTVKDQVYFFDANVWLFVLHEFAPSKAYHRKYSDFFFEVIEDASKSAKIVVCSLLISEIIGTFMRRVAVPQFEIDHPGVLGYPLDFKKDYRKKQREHHDEYFEVVKDNIKGFLANKDRVLVVNDDFDFHYNNDIISKCPPMFDFNDFYYYQLVKRLSGNMKISVVTHDSDWRVEDIHIITAEKGLLSLQRFI